MSLALDRPDEDPRDAELRKLRKINRVLMDRVERDMDVHGNNAYSLFRTAITLETEVSERTAELATLTHQLMQEISRRRQIEKALTLAKAEAEDANLGKTRFLAAATHDLYQPLNAARLFLGALADEAATARAHDLLGQVDAALDSVDELLGALLDISKLDSGAWPVTLANVAIGPMLARMAEEYLPQAQAAGLDLRAVPSSAVVHTAPAAVRAGTAQPDQQCDPLHRRGTAADWVPAPAGPGGRAGLGQRHRHPRGDAPGDLPGVQAPWKCAPAGCQGAWPWPRDR